jgi:hypothetical protein
MTGADDIDDGDTLDLSLPEPVGRGRVSPERQAAYDARVEAWCQRLLDLKPRIDFDPGSRGWCTSWKNMDCRRVISTMRRS